MGKKSKDYLEGKISGMAKTYVLAYDAIVKASKSLEDVWMIHDLSEGYPAKQNESKQQIEFALGALKMALEVFDASYYEKIEKAKQKLEGLGEE
jgi:translation elongation factor EF-1beta